LIAAFAAGLASALALLAPTPASTLLAAGDVASCRSDGDEATAALVARTPGTVAVLGDAVYERGTRAELARCYSWRGFRDRTRTALGNHEYGTGSAAAAIAYFRLPTAGARACTDRTSRLRPSGGRSPPGGSTSSSPDTTTITSGSSRSTGSVRSSSAPVAAATIPSCGGSDGVRR